MTFKYKTSTSQILPHAYTLHGASCYSRTQSVSHGLPKSAKFPSPSEEPQQRRDVQRAKPGRVCLQGLGRRPSTSRCERGEGHRAQPQHCTCLAPRGSGGIEPTDADSTETGIWCKVAGGHSTHKTEQRRWPAGIPKFSFVERGGRARRNPCTPSVQTCTPAPEGGGAESRQMPDSDPVTQRLHARVPHREGPCDPQYW